MKHIPIHILTLLILNDCSQFDAKKLTSTQKDSITLNESVEQRTVNAKVCLEMNGKIFKYFPSEDPEEMFTMIFRCMDDSINGIIFGPSNQGEHGIFFFKSEIDSIIMSNNSISFSFVQGHLYDRPFTIENYNKPIKFKECGGSRYRLFFKGTIQSDSLIFKCTSEFWSCYNETMIFKRK